jgi:hypothetical protein
LGAGPVDQVVKRGTNDALVHVGNVGLAVGNGLEDALAIEKVVAFVADQTGSVVGNGTAVWIGKALVVHKGESDLALGAGVDVREVESAVGYVLRDALAQAEVVAGVADHTKASGVVSCAIRQLDSDADISLEAVIGHTYDASVLVRGVGLAVGDALGTALSVLEEVATVTEHASVASVVGVAVQDWTDGTALVVYQHGPRSAGEADILVESVDDAERDVLGLTSTLNQEVPPVAEDASESDAVGLAVGNDGDTGTLVVVEVIPVFANQALVLIGSEGDAVGNRAWSADPVEVQVVSFDAHEANGQVAGGLGTVRDEEAGTASAVKEVVQRALVAVILVGDVGRTRHDVLSQALVVPIQVEALAALSAEVDVELVDGAVGDRLSSAGSLEQVESGLTHPAEVEIGEVGLAVGDVLSGAEAGGAHVETVSADNTEEPGDVGAVAVGENRSADVEDVVVAWGAGEASAGEGVNLGAKGIGVDRDAGGAVVVGGIAGHARLTGRPVLVEGQAVEDPGGADVWTSEVETDLADDTNVAGGAVVIDQAVGNVGDGDTEGVGVEVEGGGAHDAGACFVDPATVWVNGETDTDSIFHEVHDSKVAPGADVGTTGALEAPDHGSTLLQGEAGNEE